VGNRAARHLAKAQGVRMSPETAQTPAVLAVRVMALEAAIQRIIEVNTQNQEALKRAFLYTDAHLFVLKTICQDVVVDKVAKVEGGGLDLHHYYALFNEIAAKQAAEAGDASDPEAEGETEEMPPVEFGGDRGSEKVVTLE